MSGFTRVSKNNVQIIHHSTSSYIELRVECIEDERVHSCFFEYSEFKDLIELVDELKQSEQWLLRQKEK